MAFSTQRDFFHVPFMNEKVQYGCKKACVQLKTYGSTTDDRSWAIDETTKSKFLCDVVKCLTPIGGFVAGSWDDVGVRAGPIRRATGFHRAVLDSSSGSVTTDDGSSVGRSTGRSSHRNSADTNEFELETSTDVKYLQDEVNRLRKENRLLRMMEVDRMTRIQPAAAKKAKAKVNDCETDAESLKSIIDERNALREKCKKCKKDLDKNIEELKRKAKSSDSLSVDLQSQHKYICGMQEEMQCMQDYYEDQLHKSRMNEHRLKCQIANINELLVRTKAEAQKVASLRCEVDCLRSEVSRRDTALLDYDNQYKQLMFVVEELQGNPPQNPPDTQSDYIDDLAFYASATLSQIMKELNRRGEGRSCDDGTFGWPRTDGGGTGSAYGLDHDSRSAISQQPSAVDTAETTLNVLVDELEIDKNKS